ncbi:iron complex outermembrane recepter protein [Filimonas lacunae]|uniref:Iron complex outermembrane recepter protein n=1 Tax=Filimonas lacunae TaxID=477680 RepID=A0A173MRT7_9BACT|nr:TonB-dependent receptor [Filimonas lacunae]BAV10058.1 outer membrane protein SusC, starch binding [Filimonas lacunae]SIS83342.1 iron complex outermembrane recepter protein [Filimonas lacunae]
MNFKRLLLPLVLPLLCLALPALAQDKVVTGKITDSKDGSPLADVSILVKGSTIGTRTKADGTFTLRIPAGKDSLELTSLNYATQVVAIEGTTINVRLEATNAALGEVVVIGYGTAKKKELTGSVVSVGSKDFQKGTITSPDQLIAGKVPGVSITPAGGQPGSGSTIRIRGGASISGSNDPLYVIDGVPVANSVQSISGVSNPMALINPNDIENITVLKDAASTAIYGSRASNGVILITTKKGKSGKPVLNFSTNVSSSKAARYVDVLSAAQVRSYVQAQGDTTYTKLLGSANTNWQKEIFRTAVANDNNLSVSGAIKKVPYRVSVGFLNQDGILKNDHLDRYSAAINVSPKFFDDHLKVDINLKGTIAKSRFGNQDAISSALTFDPTQTVYSGKSAYGGYFEWVDANGALNTNAPKNPVGLLNQKEDRGQVNRSFGNIQFDYKLHFLPELRANLNLGYDIAKGDGYTFIPQEAASNYSTGGSHTIYKQKVNNRVGEFFLNYNKDLKQIKSNINVTAGYGYYDNLTTTYNYPTLNARDSVLKAVTYAYDKPRNTLISYYARLIYTFDSKYILSASYRTDGSSKFAPDYRWGKFPSVGVTWRASQENFLKGIDWLSDLKVRGTYGVTGNQDGIGNYGYIGSYSYSANNTALYQFGNTFYYTTYGAAYITNLRWEETRSANIGLDFGFFKNRITGSIDYYEKKTKDLLGPITLPVGSNFTNIVTANVGNMSNKGVELAINASIINHKDFSWNAGFNIAYNKNTITSLTQSTDSSFAGNTTGGITGGTGNTIQIHSVGYSPNAFYVYKQVYDKNGKPIEGVYADLNGDHKVDDNDLYRYKSPFPKFILGFTTDVTYKKWTLATVLRGNIGNYVYNNVAANIGITSVINNTNKYISNAASDAFKTGFQYNQFFSDYYVQNASFLRMDNLSLSYNVGRVLNNKVGMTVMANCQNVFVITKYKGVDPEVGYLGTYPSVYTGVDYKIYPRPRTYTLGVNLTFN